MAARRLLALLIALLIISSFAAALAPQRETGDETTPSTTTGLTERTPPGDGAVLRERIDAEPEEPVRIEAEPGDQLALTVEVSGPSPVAIPDLGQSRFATAPDPARFDLLLRREGRFAVTVDGERRPVAVIVVEREP